MNNSIQPWLELLYRKLLLADVALQLPGTALADVPVINQEDARQLFGAASSLALEDHAEGRAAAYEIATRLVEIFGSQSPSIVAAADIILSQLGNFPSRRLLRNRHTLAQIAPKVPTRLALERVVREVENSVTGPDDQPVPLTDFQFTLYDRLNRFQSVSVSAPTSAGKSFVMGLDLVRRLKKGGPACVVYAVPTRALIREVTIDVRRHLGQAGLGAVPVRSVPFPIAIGSAPLGAVFVLTPERLMSLLHPRQGTSWITSLIVDEAQGIRDGARGVVLQTAIETVVSQFPQADIHFASPLTSNPEFLLRLIGRPDHGAFVDTVAPVSQNLILVSEVYRKTTQASFALLIAGEQVDLGTRDLGFPLRGGTFKQRALLARAVTKDDEATILFANEPADTEELAIALIEEEADAVDLDPDASELIEFIRNEIHPEYPLIATLAHRVTYHYGSMPAIIRARVEDIFKNGILKYMCCTSTLLQGVNLPARHIIIEKPKRGRSGPMFRRDFLNLAGRAGRLLREFHGNVWCVRPSDWEQKIYDGDKLQEISSAMDEAMADGGTIVQKLLNNEPLQKDEDLGEAALGTLYCDYVRMNRSIIESGWRTPENEVVLAETARLVSELNVTLPTEILDANRGVRPDRLQALFERLSAESAPASLVPLRPGSAGSNDRMGMIIKIVEETLGGINNDSHKFYTWLASKWIYNVPLRIIIKERLAWLKRTGNTQSISLQIRELLDSLEKDIRFRLVKYYMAYVSVVDFVLRQRGETLAADSIEPFHVYLECGASDRVALNLISLGLSRSTALALRQQINFSDDATPEDCFVVLRATSFDRLSIPALCAREVKDLIRY